MRGPNRDLQDNSGVKMTALRCMAQASRLELTWIALTPAGRLTGVPGLLYDATVAPSPVR